MVTDAWGGFCGKASPTLPKAARILATNTTKTNTTANKTTTSKVKLFV